MVPLRYNISSWNQLPDCQSNNSRDLKLSVTTLIQNDIVNGTVIQLSHKLFGVLFSCLVNGSGRLLSECSNHHIHELTTEEILCELAKFGFLITYNPREHLSGDQLQYLMTLDQLGFDKIRILDVYKFQKDGRIKSTPVVVAFKISENSRWLENTYTSSEVEFNTSMNNGSSINISAISADKHFDWSWLDYIADIKDILEDNA